MDFFENGQVIREWLLALSNGAGTGPRIVLQKGPRLTLGLERIG